MKNLVTLANRLQFERFAKKLLNEEYQYNPSLPDKKEKLRKQQENTKPYLRWNDITLSL